MPAQASRGQPSRAERSTADRILDAAEALFAERGFDATTITAIIETSGARNKSAVAYHFGSKLDLLQAVLARHTAVLDERRDALLDQIEAAGAPTLDGVVDAMILPLAAMLGDESGERYLQIQAGLLSYGNRDVLPVLARDPGRRMVRLNRMMNEVVDPPARSTVLRVLLPSLLFHGLADFARTRATRREREEFVTALRGAAAAILRDASTR